MRGACGEDWALFARASHDESALGDLFERHRHYVYRLAWGLLNDEHAADDVVQEVFLKMRTGKLKARPKARFTTWLYKVALNTAREQARVKRPTWGRHVAVTALDTRLDPSNDLIHVENLRDLGLALSALPAQQREVVVLRFLEGFDTHETAEIIGRREGTVKAHLHRATLKLRDLLGND